MLFPGSRIWYEGAVADLATLIEEIKTSRFAGHIVLEFADTPAVLVCAGGQVVKVFEKIGGRFQATKNFPEVWDRCQSGQGRLTVFELPPRLAQRLRGIRDRRVLCRGTADGACDPLRLLGELKRGGFSGILDVDSPEGKLLLELEAGAVVACYATAAAGPALEGLDAFHSWHKTFVRAAAPSTFFVAELGDPGEGWQWDEILVSGAERAHFPLPTSAERLAQRYGRTAAAGELLFAAGARPGTVFSLLSGEIELFPGEGCGIAASRRLGPGALLGITWLKDLAPVRFGARALSDCRYLAFGREDLSTVFANSPSLAARCVRAAAVLLARTRSRLDALRGEPRLHDVESAVVAALERSRPGSPEGIPEGELLRELAEALPLPAPEIEALFRRLLALGSFSRSGGTIALTLREL